MWVWIAIFASPFLFFLVRSIKVNKNQHNLPFKEGIRVNQENLNERESFFEGGEGVKKKVVFCLNAGSNHLKSQLKGFTFN